MRAISVHVHESYGDLKLLARAQGRPVAALIRDAIDAYLARSRQEAPSVLDIPAHDSGPMLRGWTRAELLDEMLDR